jgi:hypothetical protein
LTFKRDSLSGSITQNSGRSHTFCHMELEFKFKKKASEVITYFSDSQLFVSVHPLIYKMELIDNEQFIVYEKTSILGIPYSFTYPARIQKKGDYEVEIYAFIQKMIHVTMLFRIVPQPGGCQLMERIDVKPAFPFKWIMEPVLTKYHKLLFEKIEKA